MSQPEIKDVPLIKIQTLKKKHAEQIRCVPYNGATGSEWKAVYDGLCDGILKPIGWTKVLGAERWLLFYNNQWCWQIAPNPTSDLAKKYTELPQLFLD